MRGGIGACPLQAPVIRQQDSSSSGFYGSWGTSCEGLLRRFSSDPCLGNQLEGSFSSGSDTRTTITTSANGIES